MLLLLLLVKMMLLALVPWTTASAGESHFKPCPDQWTDHNRSCYRLTSRTVSLQDAIDTCQLDHAYLVCIEGQQENDFVTGFLNSSASSAWLGARYDRSKASWVWTENGEEVLHNNQIQLVKFDRWSYGSSLPVEPQYCSAVGSDGWWDFQDCSGKLPFLCETRRSCLAGWYGADCSAQCHCSGSNPCRQEDGLCSRGCAQGWTGASCNIASFHCLKTDGGDLRADLTVDVKRRRYRVIQAVSQEGRALPSCVLPRVRQRASQVFLTLLLPAAFPDVSANDTATDGNATTDVVLSTNDTATDGNTTHVVLRDAADGADVENATDEYEGPSEEEGVSLSPEVTGSDQGVGSPTSPWRSDEDSVVAAGDADTSSVVTVAGFTAEEDSASLVAADDVMVTTADDVTVTDTGSWEQGTEAPKRDVSSVDRHTGKDCVASRTENGTVTWLIEFKEFPDVLTGNDVTVEVTCDLEEVDELESIDTVSDDNENGDPLDAAMMPVTTSVYLTDNVTGQRAEHFHLGQRLRLHVDVEGLTDHECAFPHSCVVKPHGALGSEVQILDELGCGKGSWPVQTLTARHRGHFVSNAFPAFSLTITNSLDLKCQVHLEPTANYGDCLTSCRSTRRQGMGYQWE